MRLFHLPADGRSRSPSPPLSGGRPGTRRKAWISVAALGALGPAGCDGAPQGPDEVPAATSITIAGGAGQRGNVGFPLPRDFSIRVADAEGRGMGDVEVTWTVTSGGGLLSLSSGDAPTASVLVTRTDADGRTAALLTPTLAGRSTVDVAAAGVPGSPATFTAMALAPDWPDDAGSALVYDRTSYHPGTISYFGGYFERYLLNEEGTFRRQSYLGYLDGPDGPSFWETAGTYTVEGSAVALSFSDDARWRATATLADDCLTVVYNEVMMWSDFEDAEFCRS